MAEQQSEQTIKVRRVTNVHCNWSSQGFLESGKFSFQLILDDGAVETMIMPTAEDGKLLRDLIRDSDGVYWDTEREVITFNNID